MLVYISHRYQRAYSSPFGFFMPRSRDYALQFTARLSNQTGLPEVICSKVAGQKDDAQRKYVPEEKHPVNIDLALNGPNSLTLHRLQRAFWLHQRSLCMAVRGGDGEISWSPMLMEFVETNQNRTEKPRSLHLIRITSWPQYMNYVLSLSGKWIKDNESGQWTPYRTLVTGRLPGRRFCIGTQNIS